MNLKQLLHVCTGFFPLQLIIGKEEGKICKKRLQYVWADFFMWIIPVYFFIILIASLLTQKPYASVQNHNFMKITSMPILESELIKKPFTTSLVKTV